jgi:hypothetical protein
MPIVNGEVVTTYYSDPLVTHVVETAQPVPGYGIYGYYHSEMEAHRVKRWLEHTGCTTAKVVLYEERKQQKGVHPLVMNLVTYIYRCKFSLAFGR